MEEEKEYFNAKNWALLDIEYIQCTRTHRCIRKLYILAKDGYTDLQLEFFPCVACMPPRAAMAAGAPMTTLAVGLPFVLLYCLAASFGQSVTAN